MRLVIILASAGWLTGQPTPEPRIAINTAARLPVLASILSQDEVTLQQKLALGRRASGSADFEEARMALEDAMREANLLLATPLLPPSSLATLTDKGEDILVAQWPPAKSTESRPILLWDDSIGWTLIFQCEAKRLQTVESLKQLIVSAFNWTTYRLGSAGFCLRQPPGAGTLFVGYGYRGERSVPRPVEIGPEITFTAFTEGRLGYWSISALSRHFGLAAKDIDERFPPLRERVSQWPLEKLMREIGNSRRAKYLPYGSYDRDGILAWEAARRPELSPSAFLSLLLRRVGRTPSMGEDVLPEVIRGAIQAGTVARFADTIDQYLDPRTATSGRIYAAGLIFSALSGSDDIDLERRAIEHLRRPESRYAVMGCLKYLEKRGKTVEARDAVEALPAQEWWGRQRQATLAALNQRLRQ